MKLVGDDFDLYRWSPAEGSKIDMSWEKYHYRCRSCNTELCKEQNLFLHDLFRAHHAPFLNKMECEEGKCTHYSVEPLPWMKKQIEKTPSGDLICPNSSCGSLVGTYSWWGIRCSCDHQVHPAFMLHLEHIEAIELQE